jgi:hypothetical protein
MQYGGNECEADGNGAHDRSLRVEKSNSLMIMGNPRAACDRFVTTIAAPFAFASRAAKRNRPLVSGRLKSGFVD